MDASHYLLRTECPHTLHHAGCTPSPVGTALSAVQHMPHTRCTVPPTLHRVRHRTVCTTLPAPHWVPAPPAPCWVHPTTVQHKVHRNPCTTPPATHWMNRATCTALDAQNHLHHTGCITPPAPHCECSHSLRLLSIFTHQEVCRSRGGGVESLERCGVVNLVYSSVGGPGVVPISMESSHRLRVVHGGLAVIVNGLELVR